MSAVDSNITPRMHWYIWYITVFYGKWQATQNIAQNALFSTVTYFFLMENSMLLSQCGCSFTAVCYSEGQSQPSLSWAGKLICSKLQIYENWRYDRSGGTSQWKDIMYAKHTEKREKNGMRYKTWNEKKIKKRKSQQQRSQYSMLGWCSGKFNSRPL